MTDGWAVADSPSVAGSGDGRAPAPDPATREAPALAVKAGNPFYAWVIRIRAWLDARSRLERAVVLVILPLLVLRALRSQIDHPWAKLALGVALVAILLIWAIEPAMNMWVMLTRRGLLSSWARAATAAYLVYNATAAVLVVIGLPRSEQFFTVAAALAVLGACAVRAHLAYWMAPQVLLVLHTVAGAIALATVVVLLLAVPGVVAPLTSALVVAALGLSFFTWLA